jgi:hypothetical protein
MVDTFEPLSVLLQRYKSYEDEPAQVHSASLTLALAGGRDPLKIVDYFRSLGLPVRSLDDLLLINGDPHEEELHAFRVAEGVAVSVASDGTWALYTP